MSNMDVWYALAASAMAAALAIRQFGRFELGGGPTVRMALIWVAIIGGLALAITYLQR